MRRLNWPGIFALAATAAWACVLGWLVWWALGWVRG